MSDSIDNVSIVDTESSITDTSSEALAANHRRRFLLISNEGSNDVWIRFGGTPATTTTGHKIAAGGNLLIDKRPPSDAVNAICDTSLTSTLFISEG